MRSLRVVLRFGLIVTTTAVLASCSESTTSTDNVAGSDSSVFSLPDTLVRLTDDAQYDRRHPCWDFSGRQLFYARYEIRNPGNIVVSEIYSTYELNGKETQHTFFAAFTDFPSVRPSYIAYRSDHNGYHNIYYGGSNWETPVTNTPAKDFEVTVTPPDASGRLAFSKADTTLSGLVEYYISTLESTGLDKIAFCRSGDVFMRNPDGSNEVQLTFDTQFAEYPAWSPNGNYLAYGEFDSYQGRYVIYIKDVKHILTSH